MKTPDESEEQKSTPSFYKPDEKKLNSKSRRSSFLPLILLALPIIFMLIALTKVLASEEYNPPLETETINWKKETVPVDTSFSDTAR